MLDPSELNSVEPFENIIKDDENTKNGSELFQADMITQANEIAFVSRLEKKKNQLSYVTEDNLSTFTLQDVVMVLPGHGVAYPKVCKHKSGIEGCG